MNNDGKAVEPPKWSPFDLVMFTLLCGMCMLLPLERGFPNFTLGPIQMPFGLMGVGAAWIYCAVLARLIRPEFLFTRFSLLQTCMVVVLVIAAFRGEVKSSLLSTLRIAAMYGATWIGLHGILTGLTNRYGPEKVGRVICAVGCVAALVGIVEAIVGRNIGPYATWQENYLYVISNRSMDDLLESSGQEARRADGTVGNPIVYSCLMVGCAVLAMALRAGWLRIVSILLMGVAALLTVSRTTFLMGALVFAFTVLTGRRTGALRVVMVAAAGMAIAAVAMYIVVPEKATLFSDLFLQRFGLRVGVTADTAFTGLEARMDVVRRAFEILGSADGTEWLLGHGALSGMSLGLSTVSGLGTLDNAYVNLLFENGLLGLGVFLASFVVLIPGGWRKVNIRHVGVLAFLFAGTSFVFYSYLTQNLVCVALIVFLEHGNRKAALAAAAPSYRNPARIPATA